jgi:HD domain
MASYREFWGRSIARACTEALIHDVKEGYSGDTPAFGDPNLKATKIPREEAACKRIEAELPWLGKMIREYDKRDDPASKVVYEVDKVVPVAIIGLAGGDGHWHDPRYAFDRELTRLHETCSAPLFGPLGTELLEFFEERIIHIRAARVRA